jgi:hypothetical protein
MSKNVYVHLFLKENVTATTETQYSVLMRSRDDAEDYIDNVLEQFSLHGVLILESEDGCTIATRDPKIAFRLTIEEIE